MKSVRFKSVIGSLSYLSMHYLDIPPAVLKKLTNGLKSRWICTVNDSLSFQCGMMPLGKGGAFIMLSKKRMKELNVLLNDKVTVELSPDNSEFGMPVPEELVEVFAQDEVAFRRFSNLTPGKQRSIIHYVSGVKNSQSRIDRALKMADRLKHSSEGKEKPDDLFRKEDPS